MEKIKQVPNVVNSKEITSQEMIGEQFTQDVVSVLNRVSKQDDFDMIRKLVVSKKALAELEKRNLVFNADNSYYIPGQQGDICITDDTDTIPTARGEVKADFYIESINISSKTNKRNYACFTHNDYSNTPKKLFAVLK